VQFVPMVLVGGFALLVLLFYPFRFPFELDPDEGIQLMKALLHAEGASLYAQIYSDQPPLFTLMLSGLLQAFGAKVLPARLAVLGFSLVLLGSASEHLRRTWGWVHAAAAVVLLAIVPAYVQLSVSVMVGLPAIALAMLALLSLTVWHERDRMVWLILAAALLALSILVKLFTVVLVPVILAGVLLIPAKNRSPSGGLRSTLRWVPTAVWCVVFSVMLAVLAVVWVGPTHLAQLVETHLGAQDIGYFAGETLLRHTRDLWPLFALAAIGAGMSIRRRAWSSLYYAGWIAAAGFLLAFNRPVWYHQQLLVTAPAGVLAGIGLTESFRLALNRRDRGRGSILLALLAGGLAVFYSLQAGPRFLDRLRSDAPNLFPGAALEAREYDLLTLVEYFDPGGDWLITDRPMFAFRSRRSLPPALANVSQKVIRSGVLTEQQIIELIRESDAPVVLLGRFALPEVEAYLEPRYDQVYGYVDLRLYVKP
jgi:hypothetical protein